MVIRELINKSVYGTIGYISSQDDIDLSEQYILYNLSVLKEYKDVIVAANFDLFKWQKPYILMWRKYFPNSTLMVPPQGNRGHNHGYADLDNLLFDYCKENNIEWLCKSANDTILNESILSKQIEEADFYYLNGIGFGGMVKYDFNNERIINEDFYPQTNFYFINISKTDYLNDSLYLNRTYEYTQTLPQYNDRIWEYISGWSCEDFLKQCVERNNLSKYHLIPQEKYIYLLDIIKTHNIHDPSHKNIMIEGVCHFHYPNQTIYKI
jgi:hypothetical protein